MQNFPLRPGSCLLLLAVSACSKAPSSAWSGYVEGEYRRIAAPLAGQLESLAVTRGQTVTSGTALFSLERGREQAALEAAQRELARADALLQDLRKGSRPSEISAMEAQLAQAEANASLSVSRLRRQQQLAKSQFVARETLDESSSALSRDQARIAELKAVLTTARLGGRSDAVAAAQAARAAAEAAVSEANWAVTQKAVAAPVEGLVTDYYYRPGEWVGLGSPVVEILAPQDIKVRMYAAEPELAGLRIGLPVHVNCDGCEPDLRGEIAYISPREEFTPPVIYSTNAREKLVYLVELRFAPDIAVRLHPGQPVTVSR